MKAKSNGPTRRRAITSVITAAPAAAVAMAQQAAAEDLDAAAREGVKRTSAALRKLKVPIATEPVFAFRA